MSRRALFLVLSILALPSAGRAQEIRIDSSSSEPSISASATRAVRVLADRATAYLLVDGSAETAPDAAARANTKVQAVLTALKGTGLLAEAAFAVPFGAGTQQPQVTYPGSQSTLPIVVRYVVRVVPTKMDQLPAILAAGLAAGASASSAINFEVTNSDSLRRSRMAEAIQQARLDAEISAAAMGMKLGRLLSVTTNAASAVGFNPGLALSFNTQFQFASQSAPEVSVSSSVMVRWRLVPR